MKKITISLLMMALFLPALAMAFPQTYVDGGHINLNHNHNSGSLNNNYGHNNNGSYNNNNGSYNNNNGSYNNNHSDNNGHNNNNGHGTAAKLRRTHRQIKRAFLNAENIYYPFLMSQHDKRKLNLAIRAITSKLSVMMRLVNRRYRAKIREIAKVVDRARYVLIVENSPKTANKKLRRAERKYDRLMNEIMY